MDITSYLLGKNSSGGGGGGDVEKGIILKDWDADGYPATVNIVGMTTIPQYYLAKNTTNADVLSKVNKITIPLDTVEIGAGAFTSSGITSFNMPNSVTTVGTGLFSNCKSLKTATISNQLTTLTTSTFGSCNLLESVNLDNITLFQSSSLSACNSLVFTKLPSATSFQASSVSNCLSLKKVCFPKVQTFTGTSQWNACFGNCTALKQVWIGADILSSMPSHVFYGCTSLEKIYINKPRAQVEAFTGYSNAFMGDSTKTGIIVCNDDEGFITEAEFDALVIE